MLKNECLLMESDGDSLLVASLVIGYDILDRLTVRLCITDYDCETVSSRYACEKVTSASLDDDCIRLLASRFRIPVAEVPDLLVRKFRYGRYVSRTGAVRRQFKNILEFILDCGGKYRLG